MSHWFVISLGAEAARAIAPSGAAFKRDTALLN
jgi:hypothetical protein